jgi:hypothetical protein
MHASSPVFWLETVALWAFGVSWFVKGETVFTDKTCLLATTVVLLSPDLPP